MSDFLDEMPAAPKPRLPESAFGAQFMDLILHKDRVLTSINRVLGDTVSLGPIGAGPGRVFAKITAHGTFGTATGEPLAGERGYRVFVPVSLTFDLDLRVDTLSFDANLILPLEIRMFLERPLSVVWDIAAPGPDDVVIEVIPDSRRSNALAKIAGLEDELRRFIIRFVARELDKPHVRKATRIDLPAVIDVAWDVIAAQFLPNSPQDRLS